MTVLVPKARRFPGSSFRACEYTTNRLPIVFVWNGMGNTGRVVTPGVYVLTCEFIDEGGVRRVEKVTVGRGRAR